MTGSIISELNSFYIELNFEYNKKMKILPRIRYILGELVEL